MGATTSVGVTSPAHDLQMCDFVGLSVAQPRPALLARGHTAFFFVCAQAQAWAAIHMSLTSIPPPPLPALPSLFQLITDIGGAGISLTRWVVPLTLKPMALLQLMVITTRC